MTSIHRCRAVLAALALTLACATVQAGEVRIAVGALTLAPGLDLQFTYRPEESRWQLGLRAVRWSDQFDYAGTSLTETTTTMIGPTLNYLFTLGVRLVVEAAAIDHEGVLTAAPSTCASTFRLMHGHRAVKKPYVACWATRSPR